MKELNDPSRVNLVDFEMLSVDGRSGAIRLQLENPQIEITVKGMDELLVKLSELIVYLKRE